MTKLFRLGAVAACLGLTLAESVGSARLAHRELLPRDQTTVGKIRTQVVSGNSSFDRLFVEAYSAGDGVNVALLTDNSADGVNATVVTTVIENGMDYEQTVANITLGHDDPWYLVLANDEPNAQWMKLEINKEPTDLDGGWWLIPTGSMWPVNTDMTQWIVCEWNYGKPQVFYMWMTDDAVLPSSCAIVNLDVVTVY